MRSLQELSDRLDIDELLVDYAVAIDARDFAALDELFTPDAWIDYTATGGIAGTLAEIKVFLPTGLGHFSSTQHLNGPTKVTFEVGDDGEADAATGRTICHNPMTLPTADGQGHTMTVGLWYVDRFVRTAHGWRISARVEELSYFVGLPKDFPASS